MLTIIRNDNRLQVQDTDGGIWWPNEDALAEALASTDPETTLLAICDQQPTRGVWQS